MSVCSTEQFGEGRMPSSLIGTYVLYKRDTRAVVAWLVSHGTSKYKRLSVLSLQDLLGLAEIVQTRAVEMPGTIDYQFREAIAARTVLSKWYRRGHDHYGNEDQDTCNHEHFTTCLTKIYRDLCDCYAKPKNKCLRARQRRKSYEGIDTPTNRFTTLNLCDDSQVWKDDASKDEVETTASDTRKTVFDSPLPGLLDDDLGEAFESRKEIQEMHDLLSTTQYAWEQAAKGAISVVLATFVTHSVFAEFEEIESQLKASFGILDPGMLRNRWMNVEQDLSLQTADKKELESSPMQMTNSLRECWLTTVQMMLEGPHSRPAQGPSHFVLRQGCGSDSQDKEYVAGILRDIAQHIQSGILHNSVIRIGSPVYDEVGFFLTRGENEENSLRCSFGLQLLLQSCKCYYFSSQSPAVPAACRLQALKFAQQAVINIKAVLEDSTMPCKCPDTLAYHLDRLISDLQSFLHIKVFDLYFQSPWVSGSHVLEMLDALFHHGLRLFSYRTYINSILHVYNVLRQFTALQPVLLFDKLIESTLGEVIFPGGRPSRNFKVSHTRSIGGRLRFDSENRKYHHKSGSHSIAIPAHAAKATAGFRMSKFKTDSDHRFDIEKVSLLHFIKSRRYHPTKANLIRLHELSNTERRKSLEPQVPKCGEEGACYHTMRPISDPSCPNQRLQDLQKTIHAELAGFFPVAAINLFALYLTCVKIICTISDRYHASFDDTKSGQYCLCFVDDVLRAGDQCRADEKSPFGNQKLIDTCKDAILDETEGRDLDDFLWKGL